MASKPEKKAPSSLMPKADVFDHTKAFEAPVPMHIGPMDNSMLPCPMIVRSEKGKLAKAMILTGMNTKEQIEKVRAAKDVWVKIDGTRKHAKDIKMKIARGPLPHGWEVLFVFFELPTRYLSYVVEVGFNGDSIIRKLFGRGMPNSHGEIIQRMISPGLFSAWEAPIIHYEDGSSLYQAEINYCQGRWKCNKMALRFKVHPVDYYLRGVKEYEAHHHCCENIEHNQCRIVLQIDDGPIVYHPIICNCDIDPLVWNIRGIRHINCIFPVPAIKANYS